MLCFMIPFIRVLIHYGFRFIVFIPLHLVGIISPKYILFL